MMPIMVGPQLRNFGVRRVLAAFCRRLVAVEQAKPSPRIQGAILRSVSRSPFAAPLDAVLLGRPVGQAGKAATSRRTPKSLVRRLNHIAVTQPGPRGFSRAAINQPLLGFPPRQRHGRFGVRRVLAAFGKRLVAVKEVSAWNFSEPLDAALPGRQVGQANKAVTSPRTPHFWDSGVETHSRP